MFRDIPNLVVHKATIEKAIKIKEIINCHSLAVSLMRSFTARKELTRPDVAKFATNYLILRIIQDFKQPLKIMFRSTKWRGNKYKGKGVATYVYAVLIYKDF